MTNGEKGRLVDIIVHRWFNRSQQRKKTYTGSAGRSYHNQLKFIPVDMSTSSTVFPEDQDMQPVTTVRRVMIGAPETAEYAYVLPLSCRNAIVYSVLRVQT